jgi:hypothetical protein
MRMLMMSWLALLHCRMRRETALSDFRLGVFPGAHSAFYCDKILLPVKGRIAITVRPMPPAPPCQGAGRGAIAATADCSCDA